MAKIEQIEKDKREKVRRKKEEADLVVERQKRYDDLLNSSDLKPGDMVVVKSDGGKGCISGIAVVDAKRLRRSFLRSTYYVCYRKSIGNEMCWDESDKRLVFLVRMPISVPHSIVQSNVAVGGVGGAGGSLFGGNGSSGGDVTIPPSPNPSRYEIVKLLRWEITKGAKRSD